MIEIENHGPLVVRTNYWETEAARAGKLYCSVNGGAIRVLIPESQRHMIEEIRTSKYVILSRGPWTAVGIPDAVELLFEDGSDSPFAVHLSPESFDFLPAEPPEGREWVLTVWDSKKGVPHKAVERRCFWRRVDSLPCLKPWKN